MIGDILTSFGKIQIWSWSRRQWKGQKNWEKHLEWIESWKSCVSCVFCSSGAMCISSVTSRIFSLTCET